MNFPEIKNGISGLVKQDDKIVGVVKMDNTLVGLKQDIDIDKNTNIESIPVLEVNDKKILGKETIDVDLNNILEYHTTCPYNYVWDTEFKKCKIELKEDISYILLNKKDDNIIGYF